MTRGIEALIVVLALAQSAVAGDAPLAPTATADATSTWTSAQWAARADERRARGDLDGAIEDLTRALAIDPRSAQLLYRRAGARAWRGRSAELALAIEDLDAALAIEPDFAAALRLRGNVRGKRGETEKAIADLDRSIEMDPKSVQGLLWRAHLEVAIDPSAARIDADRAVELAAGDGSILAQAAQIRLMLGDEAGATEDAANAISIDERVPLAWYVRGDALLRQGDASGAARDSARACELDPTTSWYWAKLAVACIELKDDRGALAALDKAIALDPRDRGSLFLRAQFRKRDGDVDGARADAERIRDLIQDQDQ